MKRFLLILGFIFFVLIGRAEASLSVAVISDALSTQTNPYNSYYMTPDFFVQDIIDLLNKDRYINVIPYSKVREVVKKKRLISNDYGYLRNIADGYSLNFVLLKKIAKELKVNNIVVVTSSVEIQRDFLKNTLWNAININGFDTVNPTHRVSVYVALVDTQSEAVMWEGLYAKNIRNNKMKNLDTAISGNLEGMMRLKRYSKFISPEISRGVRTSLGTLSIREKYQTDVKGIVKSINKKSQIGSSKNLNNPNGTLDNIDRYNKTRKENARIKREQRAREKEAKRIKKEREREFERLKKERSVYNINYGY